MKNINEVNTLEDAEELAKQLNDLADTGLTGVLTLNTKKLSHILAKYYSDKDFNAYTIGYIFSFLTEKDQKYVLDNLERHYSCLMKSI